MSQLRSLLSSPLFVYGSLFRFFRSIRRKSKRLVVNKRPHCYRMKRTEKSFPCRLLLRETRNTALPLPVSASSYTSSGKRGTHCKKRGFLTRMEEDPLFHP